MSIISLAHDYDTNQSYPSRNDDPFDLKGYKGVFAVTQKCSLDDYAQDLVAGYGKYINGQYELNIEMLPEDDQNELARLYIESLDREIEGACYGLDDSINSNFICSLLAMLNDDNKATRERFAQITRHNIIAYYQESLNEILLIACDSYLHNSMNEQGLYASYDSDHGDIVWTNK